jgi:transcriptional regulator with XRE-family HTH domain
MELTAVFGTNLRHHRKARGLTQAALAERVELSTEMIGKIERGAAAPSFESIQRIAERLNLPKPALFGVGPTLTDASERSRLLGRIHTRLSRLNEDELARAERMLSALTD